MDRHPAAVLRRAGEDALAFLFPVQCAGCGAPDETLCTGCRSRLARPAPIARTVGAGLRVHSAFAYETEIARMLRALKEDGRTSLARPFGRALGALATSVHPDPHVRFVAVPTSRAAHRRRGYRVVETILRRSELPATAVLRVARRTADQRELGRAERARNVRGSLAVRPGSAGAQVVLVDDVVTTGATLAEAARVLEAAGIRVCGALTIAATPRRVIGRDMPHRDD